MENRVACTKLIIKSYKNYNQILGEKTYFYSDTELNEKGYPARFDNVINNNNLKFENELTM